MPSDLTGLSSVDRAVPPAAGSVGRGEVAPSYALTRIAPTEPGVKPAGVATPAIGPATTPTGAPTGVPLGRSGLDLLDVLATTDLVAPRPTTGAVAMEVGLEQARGALLRNLPGDALASLDGVWDRARRTEEGWYLRSGALTVLGLPGESERVAESGLAAHPTSVALRFVHSLARLAVGDSVGARSTLSPALIRAAGHPVLLVQSLLIDAQQGDVTRARSAFERLEKLWPDHPAITWARAALRALVADRTRQQATPSLGQSAVLSTRATPTDWPATESGSADAATASASADSGAEPSSATATPTRTTAISAREVARDVAADALERFGARIALGSPNDVARDARMLLRAFSAGGTLAAATSPEQGHAARVVLSAFLAVATGESADVPAPVRSLVAQVIPLLQHGRADDAERLVRRQSALAREPIGRLLLAVVRGGMPGGVDGPASAAQGDIYGATPSMRSSAGAVVQGAAITVQGQARGDVEKGALVPVRIGLSLIDESPAQRAAMEVRQSPARGVTPWSATSLPLAFADERGQFAGASRPGGPDDPGIGAIDGHRTTDAESSLSGWGAARATADAMGPSAWTGGPSVRIAAVICVALAAAAVVTGHGAIAIGLGVGAAWLGVRRSGHAESDRTPPHDGGQSQ